MTRRISAAAVTALAALLAVGVPGAAHADTPAPTAQNLQSLATEDCTLIDELQPVVTELLSIVNGGTSTPGSVAWLDNEAAIAKSTGHVNLANWLSERATLRQEQGAILTTRQQMLAQGSSWCAAHGYGTTS